MNLPPSFAAKSLDPQFIDMMGQKCGRLTVVGYAGYSHWWCQCECGQITKPFGPKIRRGTTKSCGCHKRDQARKTKTHGHAHQGRHTREYRTWASMKSRCYDPTDTAYTRYGAVGIAVCDRWRNSFESFLADMGEKPLGDFSIDRFPDGAGDYAPENCRWATRKQQNRNRKSNHLIELNGERVTVVEACETLNLDYDIVRTRLNKGFSWERAITQPVRRLNGTVTAPCAS